MPPQDVAAWRVTSSACCCLARETDVALRLRYLLVTPDVTHPHRPTTARLVGTRRYIISGQTPLEWFICNKVLNVAGFKHKHLSRVTAVTLAFLDCHYDINAVNAKNRTLLREFDKAYRVSLKLVAAHTIVASNMWQRDKHDLHEFVWTTYRAFLVSRGARTDVL